MATRPIQNPFDGMNWTTPVFVRPPTIAFDEHEMLIDVRRRILAEKFID
jgi:hypothetical protein